MAATATTNSTRQARTNESGMRRIISLPDDLVAKLLGYIDLAQGWDSRHAPAPTTRAVANAFDVLQRWHAHRITAGTKCEVSPATDGGVDFTFDRGALWLSVLCTNDGRLKVERSDQAEVTLDDAASADVHLNWLLEQN